MMIWQEFFCHLFEQNMPNLNEHSSNTYDTAPSVVLVYNRNDRERTVQIQHTFLWS